MGSDYTCKSEIAVKTEYQIAQERAQNVDMLAGEEIKDS